MSKLCFAFGLFLLLLVSSAPAAAPATAPATQPHVRDLFAHGTDQRFWSADMIPVRAGRDISVHTIVRGRDAGGAWREIAHLASPTTGLGHRGDELLLVTPTGQWMIASEGGVRTGTPLPGGAETLAVAGDGEDIWAVGVAPPGKLITPASRPSSAPSSGPTTATSSPPLPPHELGLFRLQRGVWTEQDLLPSALGREDVRPTSLAMIDGRLMLAVGTRERAVRVFTRLGGAWDAGESITTLGENGEIRLMRLEGHPAIWVADATTPSFGSLFIRRQGWDGPIKLEMSPRLQSFDAIALTVALGRLRLLASDGQGRLAEQLYNADGTLAGQATEAFTSPRGSEERLANAMQVLVLVILLAWMVGSMRQRPAMQEAVRRLEQLRLAPHGRRLLGGIIDLLPLVIALLIAEEVLRRSGQPAAARLTFRSPEFAWLTAGIGLYLLLTTGLEMLLGRSIGKLLTGTRVASLDGSRAAISAVLLRNLLRLVDLLLLAFPLAFILFSPLRQRIGDMAAGTLVVMNDAPMPPKPSESAPKGDDTSS